MLNEMTRLRRCRRFTFAAALPALLALAACGRGEPAAPSSPVVRLDRPDRPLTKATAEELARFDEGDALFELTARPRDGLGPLFIRASCASCHRDDGRGPGLVAKFAAVEAGDGVPALPYGNTERPYTAAGAQMGIRAPAGDGVRITYRLPPAVYGRGYLEAIEDAEIERLAAAAARRTDGVRGRIHRVAYASEANPGARVHAHRPGQSGLIGRFGLKARIATLDEFTADALQGDMGMTSPLRPRELPNPEGLMDDEKPGVDTDLAFVNAMTDYVRLLELPARRNDTPRGRSLFAAAGCATCHTPTLRTRADYPIAALAGIDAPVYTDLLLHDMGDHLADGVRDGDAGPREWRTAPLIGLRFFPAFLHDGRARTVEAAILAHEGPGSEGNAAVTAFRALSPEDRRALLDFVGGL
jgi:CxxC motif-containing protein (DUF1111 family)